MGIFIALENEFGQRLQTVLDDKNLLHKLLPSYGDESYPMLGSIDWYGDTVFNALQMKQFLKEWDRLIERAWSLEEKGIVTRIRALALECKNGVHLYLKFIGD